MKKFFKLLLLGLGQIFISLTTIGAILLGIIAFTDIPNQTGFIVVGMLAISILSISFGIGLLYLSGDVLNVYRERNKNQQYNKES